MAIPVYPVYPSDLTDAEWEYAQHYLPPMSTRGRPRTHPLRRILDVIFYLLRTGWAWRYLPSNFPPWQTVFYHFRRFRLNGTWHRLYTTLHLIERERAREAGRDGFPTASRPEHVAAGGKACHYNNRWKATGWRTVTLVVTLGGRFPGILLPVAAPGEPGGTGGGRSGHRCAIRVEEGSHA